MRKFTLGLLALTFVLSLPLVAGELTSFTPPGLDGLKKSLYEPDFSEAEVSPQMEMGPAIEPNG